MASYEPGCPHCEDGHETPGHRPWNVRVAVERDHDGQAVGLYVAHSQGSHVAESDALWLWRLIRERDPAFADRPLDLDASGMPRLAP